MLDSPEVYGRFVYSIRDAFPSIKGSTLVFYMVSAKQGVLKGELEFAMGITLEVAELVDVARVRILRYSYAVKRNDKKLYWYDPQPHPKDPYLAQTHPHHKHVPPDIKRNRMPAPRLSFEKPNLPFLIEEIERELLLAR